MQPPRNGSTPEFDVLIPFHEDVPLRRTIWEHNRALWDGVPSATVCVSDDPGRPAAGVFSPGKARNAAAAEGSSDWIVAYGSDEVPPSPEVIRDAFRRARRTRWSGLFSGTRVVKPMASEAFATGAEPELGSLRLSTRIPTATGLILVSRDLFERVHGYDERFAGWGFEDSALRKVLAVLSGIPPYPPSGQDCFSLSPYFLDLVALYRASLPNRELYEREYSSLTKDELPALFERRNGEAGGLSPTGRSSAADAD